MNGEETLSVPSALTAMLASIVPAFARLAEVRPSTVTSLPEPEPIVPVTSLISDASPPSVVFVKV
jgi:hypothetical protein